jgi:hypothetical protein
MPEIAIPPGAALPEATVVSAPPRAAALGDASLDGATVRLDVAPGLGSPTSGAARGRRAAAVAVAVVAAGVVAVLGAQVIRGVEPPPAPTSTSTAPAAPVVASGRLHVETTPPGVTVLAGDSRVLGKSPIDAEFPPGPVHLQAQFADQPPRAIDAVVVAGQATSAAIHAWVPVVVQSTPSKAKVRIDGALRGETPFDQGFLVEPGKAFTVRLEAPGFATWEEQRTAAPGVALALNVKLVAATSTTTPTGGSAVAARDEFGAIRVNVDPWADVKLGDAVLGEAPFNDKRVRAGRQILTLTNPEMGLKDAFPVVVPADKTLVVIVRYEKKGATWALAQKTVR